MEGSKSPKIIKLETDYLVIGSGAMGMAFVDEMLIGSSKHGNNQNTEFIIIDKHAKPGGHWNDAYQFVTLHQPAAFYGVNSKFLGEGINQFKSLKLCLHYQVACANHTVEYLFKFSTLWLLGNQFAPNSKIFSIQNININLINPT